MKSPYLQIDVPDSGTAYVKRDIINKLLEVDAAIFDCDGVLIDARNSYNRAIAKTASYIIEGLTGVRFPEEMVTDEVIIAFKRGGGFNSDWDLAYAIIMFTLCNLPESFWSMFRKHLNNLENYKDSLQCFCELKKKNSSLTTYGNEKLTFWRKRILKFAETIGEKGIESVDYNLMNNDEICSEAKRLYLKVKNILSYPGGIGESVVSTVFEEFFRGPKLFKTSCNLEPRFNKVGNGLIELEKPIITFETLEKLEKLFGEPRFGIASGSFFKPAQYVLGNLLEKFRRDALIFYDEIFKAEIEASKKKGRIVSLKKPNPFPLFRAAKSLEPFNRAVYIGDSMEDAFTVKNANEREQRFLFVGVYKHSPPMDVTLKDFIKAECEVILPTVNDLPFILELVRRKQK